MAEDNWQQARLIPTSGINGVEEAERRATSALLAVMGSVREFGQAMVRGLGAPAGSLATFIEVPLKADERTIYPDGLLQTSRGSRSWTCLVEVKTGSSALERPQVEAYLDVARENGFDGVLTISNEMSPAPGVHPVDVDRRKLKKVALHHLSWAEVLTVAVQQRVHRGVSDPDQAWILGELIRYLEHPKSGALDFSDMGASWVPVRESLAAGTLRTSDKGLPDVVSRWEQLLRFAALRLGRELGADVQVQLTRREAAEPTLRFAAQTQSLVSDGLLVGTLKIPDAVAPINVTTDLRAGRVVVSIDVDAPREGRSRDARELARAAASRSTDGLRIDAFAAGARSSTSELLRVVRENPTALVSDPKREFRFFRIAATSPLGAKRGVGHGGFIDSVLAAIDGFYETVVQALRPWSAKAPQLPRTMRTAVEEAGIDVEPPARDLQEAETDTAALTSPPDTSSPPAVVEEGVEAGISSTDDSDVETRGDVVPTVPVDEEEMMSWDQAHDRLDHERTLDNAALAGTAADQHA